MSLLFLRRRVGLCIRELSQSCGTFLAHSGAFVLDCILICIANIFPASIYIHEGGKIL